VKLDKKISNLAKNFGLDRDEHTIVKIKDTDNPNQKLLELQSGSFEESKPWFVIDDDNRIYPIINDDAMIKVFQTLKSSLQDNFNIKLEKAILEQMPVDFSDVWAVVMNEIKKETKVKPIAKINVEKIVKDVKKFHPNLFFQLDLKEMMSDEGFFND